MRLTLFCASCAGRQRVEVVKDTGDSVLRKVLHEGEGYDKPNEGATVTVDLVTRLVTTGAEISRAERLQALPACRAAQLGACTAIAPDTARSSRISLDPCSAPLPTLRWAVGEGRGCAGGMGGVRSSRRTQRQFARAWTRP